MRRRGDFWDLIPLLKIWDSWSVAQRRWISSPMTPTIESLCSGDLRRTHQGTGNDIVRALSTVTGSVKPGASVLIGGPESFNGFKQSHPASSPRLIAIPIPLYTLCHFSFSEMLCHCIDAHYLCTYPCQHSSCDVYTPLYPASNE